MLRAMRLWASVRALLWAAAVQLLRLRRVIVFSLVMGQVCVRVGAS